MCSRLLPAKTARGRRLCFGSLSEDKLSLVSHRERGVSFRSRQSVEASSVSEKPLFPRGRKQKVSSQALAESMCVILRRSP